MKDQTASSKRIFTCDVVLPPDPVATMERVSVDKRSNRVKDFIDEDKVANDATLEQDRLDALASNFTLEQKRNSFDCYMKPWTENSVNSRPLGIIFLIVVIPRDI